MPRNNLIQFRKGTAEDWLSTNPILASGEPAFNTTDYTLKVGDGSNLWADLPNIGASGTDTYINNASFDQPTRTLTLSYNNSLPDLNVNIPAVASSGDNSFLVYQNISTNTTLSYNDHLIFVDTASNAIDVFLPLASGYGGKQFIIKQKNGLNPINIFSSGTETIDDAESYQIFYSKNAISIVSDNSNWYII